MLVILPVALHPSPRHELRGLDATNLLCVWLMQQRALADDDHDDATAATADSSWHEYVRTLPREYSTPCYWSRDEINALPPWIKDAAIKQRQVRGVSVGWCFVWNRWLSILPQ